MKLELIQGDLGNGAVRLLGPEQTRDGGAPEPFGLYRSDAGAGLVYCLSPEQVAEADPRWRS
jgi:hypothetical protein